VGKHKSRLVDVEWPRKRDFPDADKYMNELYTLLNIGEALSTSMGTGWRGRIWFNFGWHLEVISPCKRVDIHYQKPYDGRHTPSYVAYVHKPGETGCRPGWYARAKTVEKAYADAVRNARREVKNLVAIVEGL
jgi:hypothetical protein